MVQKPSVSSPVFDDLHDEFALLRVCLARVPDFRVRQGKLYGLPEVLALAVLEKRTSLEASRAAGAMPHRTAVEMVATIGIDLDPWKRAVLETRKQYMVAS